MPDLSILIVCYKSKDLIGPMLEGLFKHTQGVSYEVLLTDCSQDGTEEFVTSRYPEVRIVSTKENLGFAKGNNFLAKHALGQKLLLINPDVLVEDNAVGNLFQCSCDFSQAKAWGGVTRFPNGKPDPSCQQKFPTIGWLVCASLGLGGYFRGGLELNAKEPREVEGLSGAFMMVDRSIWEEFGGFDETFFMYAEELDLCYRIHRAGHALIMTPHASIIHLVGGGAALSPRRAESVTRAKMHFFRKHFSRFGAVTAGLLLWLIALNRTCLGTLRGMLGHERSKKLAQANWPLVQSPQAWWAGYKV